MSQDNLIEPFMIEAAAILNNKRPPSERKLEEQRAMFLEGYIRFAEIFAQNELGSMEIDIAKLALYVFSPEFKYQMTYQIKNIDDVFKIIEEDILNGMPIWRYFKCSKRIMQIFEDTFRRDTEEEEQKIKEKYMCKRCKHLQEKYHDLGHYCVCRSRQREYKLGRSGYHDYTKIEDCKYFENE
jgi:hypothetical protein